MRLSHPERLVFPKEQIAKRELAEYYEAVGALHFRHYANRPASFVRCPDGVPGKCFFQKHGSAAFPAKVSTVDIVRSGGETDAFLALTRRESLVGAVQGGAIEIHLWGARIDRIEKPDRIVFDLDPDEDLDFSAIREAAFGVRAVLKEVGLASFAMLTGGKGIHVIAPIARTQELPEVKAFCRGTAETLARATPSHFTAAASKARRRNKIFIDWMRNQRGATAIAPFAVRARENAPVAAPVSWRELKSAESAAHFDMRSMRKRLSRKSDPWPDYFDTRQSISKKAYDRLARNN